MPRQNKTAASIKKASAYPHDPIHSDTQGWLFF